MKKKAYTIFLIVCVILAAALLLSVIGLVSARSKAKAAAEQILILIERVQELENQNQTLQAQLDAQSSVIQTEVSPVDTEEFYCTLAVDSWEVKDGKLTADTFAQAVLSRDANFSAQIELWRGDAVLASQDVLLDIGEADGVFESDVKVTFQIPEIEADEELQLWLMVKPVGSDAIFACGAGWYLEDGVLMLITG